MTATGGVALTLAASLVLNEVAELRSANIRLHPGARSERGAGNDEGIRHMTKVQSRFVMLVATVALVLTPLVARAQTALAAAEISSFLGEWTLSVQSPQGPFEINLAIKDVEGKAAGEFSSAMAPQPMVINEISKAGEDLVMKFTADFQGMPLSAKITLVPEGTGKAKASFDIMDGAFVMDGTAVKK
jgi:hypothetical protein